MHHCGGTVWCFNVSDRDKKLSFMEVIYCMTLATEDFFLEASSERISHIVTFTLRNLGWEIRNFAGEISQVVASKRHSEVRLRMRFDSEFVASVRWNSQALGAYVSVQVSEEKNTWTQYECEQRCRNIRSEMETIATRIARSPEPQANAYGAARFATAEDIQRAGYWGGVEDSQRLVLAPGDDLSYITVPSQQTAQHAIVCGPTGCGKTTSIFIPNLLERLNSSAIVTEATAGQEPPDLYWKTCFYRWARGHQHIYYFNPDDLTSDRINPLDQVKSVSDAVSIADLIIKNTTQKSHKGDQMWENGERHLLTALVLHAAGEGGHLGTARMLLREGPDGMGDVLNHSAFREARDEYRAYYNNGGEGYRLGVSAGLMQRLNPWIEPKIVALTQTTDIDVLKLPEQLFTFYLAVPADKLTLKPVASLVFNYVLSLALNRNFKHPLTLLLDEFTNFGYLPGIAEKLTIIRHKAMGAVLGMQDFVQLKKVYGEDDAKLLFNQPGTRVFFRPNDPDTARKISESLGTKTVVRQVVASDGRIQRREFPRPLMDAAEVMGLDSDKAIVFTRGTPPILMTRFAAGHYDDVTQFEPPARSPLQVDERLTRACEEAEPDLQETISSLDAHRIWGDIRRPHSTEGRLSGSNSGGGERNPATRRPRRKRASKSRRGLPAKDKKMT
jgi:type IV secretion system protein VirD4